jgi:hypothetical protein
MPITAMNNENYYSSFRADLFFHECASIAKSKAKLWNRLSSAKQMRTILILICALEESQKM